MKYKNKKSRESNFELMRILSMFFIIIWHIIFHGRLFFETDGISHIILILIVTFIVIHVNSFILISGYFQYDKEITIKKFFKLFNLQWIYKILIVLFLYGTGLIQLSGTELMRELLPFGTENYWFINCYLALYLLCPFLNKLIASLKQKEYRKLLLISFVLFSIVPFITNDYTISNTGFTVIHFVFLYLIGAYLHKYPIKENIHFKNYSREKRKLLFLFTFIFFGFLGFLLNILALFISGYESELLKLISDYILSDMNHYSSPIVIIQSICYLLFFETLTIKNNWINGIATSVIAIYLIHDNCYIRSLIYNVPWLNVSKLHGINMLIYLVTFGIIIFVSCLLVETIRKLIGRQISSRKCIASLKLKFYNYLDKI